MSKTRDTADAQHASWATKVSVRRAPEPPSEYDDLYDFLESWMSEAHREWVQDHESWLIQEFDSPDDLKDAVKAARWMCERVEGGPYTFRVKRDTPDNILMYRVTNKTVRTRKSATEAADGDGGNDNSDVDEVLAPGNDSEVN